MAWPSLFRAIVREIGTLTAMLIGGLTVGAFNGGCVSTPDSKSTASTKQHNSSQLASRLSNYGDFEQTGWSHLTTIGIHHLEIPVPDAGDVDAMRRRLAVHGLTAVMLKGKTDLSKSECIDDLAVQLATCEKMGVHRMFLSAKTNGADKNVVYDRLRQTGRIAQRHGVTIALETHPDLATNGGIALETMKAIDHPNVRINFDTGNIHFYNTNTTAPAELEKIVDYVASVHLKDHNGKFKVWNFPTLGQGVVDFPQVLRILAKHGFDGPLIIELEGVKGVTMNEEQTKTYVAKSADYIRSVLPPNKRTGELPIAAVEQRGQGPP